MRDAILHRLFRTALVLATAVAFVTPTSGQNSFVLISPNVACRAAPSFTADALGVFRHMGMEGGMEIEVARRETSAAGDVWAYLREADSKWAEPPVVNGCWIPESVISAMDGYFVSETNLLQMADGLLSRTEGVSVSDLVAVYNIFEYPPHQAIVEGSPDLMQRRRQLIERALIEASVHELAADAPLITAWMYSFPDQFNDARERLEPTEWAIVAPDVACRSTPARFPTANALLLPLDYHFNAECPDTVVAGETWTFVFDGCWVRKSLIAPGDTDEHVLAIADRFELAGDEWSKANLLRAYNVFSSRKYGHRDMTETSAMLSLRRLEVLDSWLKRHYGMTDPLSVSIIRSLDAEVQHFEPGGSWTLRDETFLNLYEQHKGSPDAHAILWTFANLRAYHDCEGTFACTFRVRIMDRWAKYWIEYPHGSSVAYAVSIAEDLLGYFLKGCKGARNAAPDSWEAQWGERADWEYGGAEVAADLRTSLAEVDGAIKASLLYDLHELEACATESATQER